MTKCNICKKKTKLFTIKKKQPLTIYPKKNFNTIKYRDLSLFFCSRCDHLMQSPKPNNKTLNSIYNSDQSNYTSMLKSNKIIQARENLKINNLINVLKKKITLHNSNILEIGGYDGFTLTKLLKYAKNLYLVEPNKKACKLAKKNKINVINDVFPSKKINQKFDVIIMRHVIEHLPNISKLQNSLKRILKDNGVIVIETPELNSVINRGISRTLILQHINYFSQYSLNLLFERNFQPIKSYIDNSFDLTTFYKFKINNRNNIRKKKIDIKNYDKKILRHKERILKFLNNNNDNWIYGASSSINELINTLKIKTKNFRGIIDSDKSKVGYKLPFCIDLDIFNSDNIELYRNSNLVIASQSYSQIKNYLKSKKFQGKTINLF